jgi:hypothetical protein
VRAVGGRWCWRGWSKRGRLCPSRQAGWEGLGVEGVGSIIDHQQKADCALIPE